MSWWINGLYLGLMQMQVIVHYVVSEYHSLCHSLEQVNQHVWDKTHNFYLMRSFQVLSLDSLKVLQVLNLPNKSIFRWHMQNDYGLSNYLNMTGASEVVMELIDYFIACFKMRHLKNSLLVIQGCLLLSHDLGPAVLEEISKDINASVGCISLLLLNENCWSEETMWLFNSTLEWRVGWSLYKIH